MADRQGNQAVPGVGDQRHPGIAHQCDGGALLHRVHQFWCARDFVVLVVADQGLVNFKVIQQLQRVARVFAGDLIHFFQNAQRAQRNIFQIADRRGHQVEAAAER